MPRTRPSRQSGGPTMGLRSFLFSFEGRINRAKYWLVALAFLIGGTFILMQSLFVLPDSLNPECAGRVGQSDPALILRTVAFVPGIWSVVEEFCLRGTAR